MKMISKRRKSRGVGFVAILLALGLTAAACGEDTSDDGGDGGSGSGGSESKSLKIAYITWAEDIAATFLWEHILEERGYDVELTQVDVGPTFAATAEGDAQLFFDTWLPVTHKQYWEQYGDQLTKVAQWYDSASLEISVPTYMDDFNSIEDLAGEADTFGGKIIGIEAGAGLTDVTKNEVIPQYGLDDYTLATSSTPAMLAALEDATKSEEPIVVTLWRPHWAYAAYPVKDLEDPKGALGGAEKIFAVAPTDFESNYPDVYEWVSKFHMSAEQLADLENATINGVDSEEDRRAAVDKWAEENQDLITKWAGEPTS